MPGKGWILQKMSCNSTAYGLGLGTDTPGVLLPAYPRHVQNFPKKKNPRYRSSTHWVHVRYRLGLNDAKWHHFDDKIKTLTSLDYLTLSLSLSLSHTHTHPHFDGEEARWCAPILTFGNGKSLGCFNLDFWQRRMALV
jgi:hypothetical protein